MMKLYGRQPLNLDQACVPRGQVFLIASRCKGCGICIRFCPRHVLCESSETNGRGYHVPEIAPGMEDGCVHCQFCSLVCPDFAIFSCEVEQ